MEKRPSLTTGQDHRHFHPKGKMPSKFTVKLQKSLRSILPFEDRRDFEKARRDFVAAPLYPQIKVETGKRGPENGQLRIPVARRLTRRSQTVIDLPERSHAARRWRGASIP